MSQQLPNENRFAGDTRFESSVSGWVAQTAGRIDDKSFVALIDQAIVSGMSLIASVIVGRECGSSGLGIYSLAITIVILFVALHTALVSTPYTVFRTRIEPTAEKYFAGSSLFSSMMVILIGIVVLLLTCVVFFLGNFIPSFEQVVLTIAALFPFLILREFARRYAFAHLRMGTAVMVDLSVAVMQVLGLLLLAHYELLTPVNALIAMGVACAVSAVTWFFANRSEFVVDVRFLKKNISRKWVLGRWVVLEHVLAVVSAFVTPWLLIFMIDSSATGIFAACLVVVNLSSPFLQGMGNSLSPKFAAAAAAVDDSAAIRIQRLFWRSTLFMTGTMTLFVVVCFFAGEAIMQFLYQGEEYSGRWLTVTILAIRAGCHSAYISAHHALLAMEKPLPSVYCSLIGLVITVVGGVLLIPIYGILGGAIAMLLGTMLEVIAIYWGYTIALSNLNESSTPSLK